MACNNDDCTGRRHHNRPADNSSSFTRWSRNLSAHRRRELERLNEIEKSRRLLELKSQAHLFDQMSMVTVNNNNNNSSAAAVAGQQGGSSSDKGALSAPLEANNNNKSPVVMMDSDEGEQTLPIGGQSSMAASANLEGGDDDDPIKVSSSPASSNIDLSTKLRLTSLSSSELAATAASKGKDSVVVKPASSQARPHANETSSGQALDDEPGTSRARYHAKSDTIPSGGRELGQGEPPNGRPPVLINKPLTNDQKARFVSARVPKNKRAFYIDDSYRVELNGERNSAGANGHGASASNQDQRRRPNLSGDNSFSASSSISADMLLIGADGANGRSNMVEMNMTGNSYSDNEVYTNTETEEDGATLGEAKTLAKQRQQLRSLNVSKNLRGSESPLVYPGELSKKEESDRDSLLAWTPSKRNLSMEAMEEEEDSDNDDEIICKQGVDGDEPGEVGDREEVDYDDSMLDSLFDNDRNPYTETNGVLLAGRRRKKGKTYLIGPNEYGYTRKNSICKLKSNVLGTQFNAIRLNHVDNNINDRCNIASISYETNVLGFKGPRKMRVFLAKDPNDGTKNLQELFKRDADACFYLKNMTPSWNTESQSYVLNFHGRVTQASVKNFQLVQCETSKQQINNGSAHKQAREEPTTMTDQLDHQQQPKSSLHSSKNWSSNNYGGNVTSLPADKQQFQSQQQAIEALSSMRVVNSNLNLNNTSRHEMLDSSDERDSHDKIFTYNSSIVMQFGRISNDEFTCDVTYPLSILQAFAIALSSFDSKLACE